MNRTGSFQRLATAVAAACAGSLIATAAAWAQSTPPDYEPRRGQAGKDVMWLASPDAMVNRMLRMAEVTHRDYVVDLGSGDGKIPIAAALNTGARSLGLEYNPDLVEVSKRRAIQAGVQDKVQFQQADIFVTDFSKATVVTLYLLPELNLRLRPILFKMKPGTRISSNTFDMQTWLPDESSLVESASSYLWIIPAHAAGEWSVSYRSRNFPATALSIRQRFQAIEGEAQFKGVKASLQNANLRGTAINFTTRDATGELVSFTGKVEGNRITGTARSAKHGRTSFEAVRNAAPVAFPEAVGTEQEQIEAVRALGAN